MWPFHTANELAPNANFFFPFLPSAVHHSIRPPNVVQSPTGSSPSGSGSEPPPRQRRKPGRVPVSCAECRRCVLFPRASFSLERFLLNVLTRLKLRCDRKARVTCSSRLVWGLRKLLLVPGRYRSLVIRAPNVGVRPLVPMVRLCDVFTRLRRILAAYLYADLPGTHPTRRSNPEYVDCVRGSTVAYPC